AALQPYRVEPELRLAVVALNRDVRRLATVTDVEEEVERPAAERRRHAPMLPRPAPPSNAGHDGSRGRTPQLTCRGRCNGSDARKTEMRPRSGAAADWAAPLPAVAQRRR